MKVHRIRIGMLVLLIVFGLCCAGVALAQHHGGTLGGPHHGKGPWSSLTEEQREAVHGLVTEMRKNGATREEIHAAVTELLESYGIELPENWGEKPPGHRGPGQRFMSKLTEEQREAVHALVTEMREGGATREEIHAAVTELLKSYGVKPAEDPGSTASQVKTAESHITSRSHPNPFNPQTQITYTLDVWWR